MRRYRTILTVLCAVCVSLAMTACGESLGSKDMYSSFETVSGEAAGVVSGEAVAATGEATTVASGPGADVASGPAANVIPGIDEQIEFLVDHANLWCDETEYDEPVDTYDQISMIYGSYCVMDLDDDGYLEVIQEIHPELLFIQEICPDGEGYTMEEFTLEKTDENEKLEQALHDDVFLEHASEGFYTTNIDVYQRPEADWLRKKLQHSYKLGKKWLKKQKK